MVRETLRQFWLITLSDGATVRRFPLHKVPNAVPLAGILLSVLLAAFSWGINAASVADSAILGLIGVILSVQFEILVRHEERYEFAELLSGSKWLHESIKSIAADGAIIATRFRDTPIESEARDLLQGLCVEFANLRLGRLRRPPNDVHYLMQHTQEAKSLIRAVTNFGQGTGDPRWWLEGPGQSYFNENIAAVQRDVSIQRIIIYSEDEQDDALRLAAVHHEAGIEIKLALRETLKPKQKINFAIWDESVSWELQMNADGDPISNIYCVGPADVRRLVEIHRALWVNSAAYVPTGRS
ncbi:MAG: hypothetical protein ACT4NY_01760 [Pseudonocardiales bacterium]